MPISTADFAKFQEYKARQKTTSHSVSTSTNSQNSNPQNESSQNSQNQGDEKLPDLISWCVEDIVGKLVGVDFYREKSNMEKQNIEGNLRLEFLQNVLEVLKNKIVAEKKYEFLLEAINQSEDLEEIGKVLSLALIVSQELQQTYFSTISLFYVKKCIILNLETNKDLSFELIN